MSLSDHQTAVDRKAQAPAEIVSPADRDAAIQVAVLRYSQDRPLLRVADVVSAGGYVLPLPAGWVPGESALLSVETPVGSRPPALLVSGAFAVQVTPSGEEIVLAAALDAGAAARLAFEGPHTLSAATDTVPAKDRDALACWAAAVLCDQVAAHHAENREPTIQADRVDYTSPAREWAKRAEAYRALYFKLLGIDTGPQGGAVKPKPAGAVVNLDVPNSRLKPSMSKRLWR